MLTTENIALFIGSVVAALAVAIICNPLHVGCMDYRESRIEDEVKQLRQRGAIMLNNPADIGFPMDGYSLPKLNLIERQILTPKR